MRGVKSPKVPDRASDLDLFLQTNPPDSPWRYRMTVLYRGREGEWRAAVCWEGNNQSEMLKRAHKEGPELARRALEGVRVLFPRSAEDSTRAEPDNQTVQAEPEEVQPFRETHPHLMTDFPHIIWAAERLRAVYSAPPYNLEVAPLYRSSALCDGGLGLVAVSGRREVVFFHYLPAPALNSPESDKNVRAYPAELYEALAEFATHSHYGLMAGFLYGSSAEEGYIDDRVRHSDRKKKAYYQRAMPWTLFCDQVKEMKKRDIWVREIPPEWSMMGDSFKNHITESLGCKLGK